MKQSTKGALIFSGIVLLSFMVGSYIMASAFFGLITLIGLIFMIESIGPLKYVMSRSSKVFDMILFGFTIVATVNYGLNIAASLTFAGLGYTLFYGPYLRETMRKKNSPIGNYKSKFK